MSETSVAARAIDLVKVYGRDDAEVRALGGVSLDIRAGEFTAVMGPSGSGKSTFMHCMAALDTPTSGSVVIGDVDVAQLADKELTQLRRDRIGFVFQAFNLVPTLTAQENIVLPLSIAGREPDQEWFDQVIDAVDLRSRLSHRPPELSGGQQQRVACARALVSRPSIVFADEPTGNLDSTSGAEVLGFLRRSVDEFGQTIVMVTHDAVAASYTDRVVFLADGELVDELREPTAEAVLATMAGLQKLAAARSAVAPVAELRPARASAETAPGVDTPQPEKPRKLQLRGRRPAARPERLDAGEPTPDASPVSAVAGDESSASTRSRLQLVTDSPQTQTPVRDEPLQDEPVHTAGRGIAGVTAPARTGSTATAEADAARTDAARTDAARTAPVGSASAGHAPSQSAPGNSAPSQSAPARSREAPFDAVASAGTVKSAESGGVDHGSAGAVERTAVLPTATDPRRSGAPVAGGGARSDAPSQPPAAEPEPVREPELVFHEPADGAPRHPGEFQPAFVVSDGDNPFTTDTTEDFLEYDLVAQFFPEDESGPADAAEKG